jgi:hypothetical protein
MSKIPGPDRLLWHFVAGHPLDGHYRTDARFWRRGRKPLGKVEVSRWSYLAGWERAAVRLAVVAGVPAAVWQYLTHPTRTLAVAAAVGVLAALWASWRGYQALRRFGAYRRYVKPLDAVLRPLLGRPATVRPADYIEVPPTYRTKEETPAVIRLPREFNPSPASKELVAGAALQKLGLNEDNTDVIFRMVGDPVLELKMAPQPPDRVLWADHAEAIDALPPGKVFVGLGARSKPYIHDFTSGELVHVGVSVNTGGGKSSAVVGWMAQELRKGASSTFIDPKQSYLPTVLVGVPGYRLANDPDNVAEMWNAIEAFEREMDRRRRAMLKDRTLEYPMMYLVLDELSEFADMSRELWTYIKADPERYGYEGPIAKNAPNPIWRSVSRILRMGREYSARVIVLTQRLDNASTGGIGLRDLFGMRALGKFRKNQWLMLVGTYPVPKSVNKIGRWIYTDGAKDVWVQNVYGTEIELRNWAAPGRGMVDTHADTEPGEDVSPGSIPSGVQWDIVGNQAAADYLGIPLGTFRKRRQRNGPIAGEGLQGRSPAWMKSDLDNFFTKVVAE